MLLDGSSIKLSVSEDGIAKLIFAADSGANKFDANTLGELSQAVSMLEAEKEVHGLLVSSAHKDFIFGADITEFGSLFGQSREELVAWLAETNSTFDRLQALPFPKVAAISGYALGGGLECALCADFRLADTTARLGLPETKLGILPGFGGTVRLPRLVGVDTALTWITSGREFKADAAQSAGVVDGVCDDKLEEKALLVLERAIKGDLDWRARVAEKNSPMALNENEHIMAFNIAEGFVRRAAGTFYPAPVEALNVIRKSALLGAEDALKNEHDSFARLAKTPECASLINVFLSEQAVKARARKITKSSGGIEKTAVVGAGIMGGGVAYVSARKGIRVVMKDIAEPALDAGLNEASKLLLKQAERGRIPPNAVSETLNRIDPTLNDEALAGSQVVVEAVVENPAVKAKVLPSLEAATNGEAVIASNTSTISINRLAQSMSKPENFCGMHFFNPVHRMPLVEVIRGEKSSDETIASVVKYALQMGKTPIVVNDCPGFFVNRVLSPYFLAFNQLLVDGVDIRQADKVMTGLYGWPMGPAHLLDVVGLDTSAHAIDVMAEGFPERMPVPGNNIVKNFVDAGLLGQKSGEGFYAYKPDRRGRVRKVDSEKAAALLEEMRGETKSFDNQEIVDRLMLPMMLETARCLEEGIIASPAEGDLALIYGLGFPPFRGGVFHAMNAEGLGNVLDRAEQYRDLGLAYQAPEDLVTRASEQRNYYA